MFKFLAVVTIYFSAMGILVATSSSMEEGKMFFIFAAFAAVFWLVLWCLTCYTQPNTASKRLLENWINSSKNLLVLLFNPVYEFFLQWITILVVITAWVVLGWWLWKSGI